MSDFTDRYYANFPTTLAEWQASPLVHPYTCPDRGDGRHRENERDLGVLEVEEDNSLWCPDCGYTQPPPEWTIRVKETTDG